MKTICVAAAVINQTPLDWSGNKQRILDAIQMARSAGAQVLCLPELCITGYGCEDAFHSGNTLGQARKMLAELATATSGMVVSLGLPLLHQNSVFNCAVLVVDGSITGIVAKKNLAGDGIHYEPRWFKAWPEGICNKIELNGKSYPIGDIYFECGGVRIGFEICEDAWVANRPGAQLALKAIDLILNPSASHFAFGKIEVRKRFVLEGSRAFGVAYVYSNLLGNESGRAIYDGGALIASGGKLVATGPRFGFHDTYITSATIDLDFQRLSQARTVSFRPEIANEEPNRVSCPFIWKDGGLPTTETKTFKWETKPDFKEEEFVRAEALALFDYMRKSRSNGFVVSLSGGADSAAVVCLVYSMCTLALKELGMHGLNEKLGYLCSPLNWSSPKQMMRTLLTTAYQATKNSGTVTRAAARQIAEAVGASHYELNVEEIVQGYLEVIQNAMDIHFSWQSHDIPLQNIQARVRAPGIWLIANVKNALLLATSNRSEAAVGYATMDGDTCGGLSPLAGIDKAWLRRWLAWMEKSGPDEVGPIDALRLINCQAPTAELRPSDKNQTDEDDLMPYEVLDFIERAAIRDKRSPLEVFQLLINHYSAIPSNQLAAWVERFFQLWRRNQWKRERYAPSFHLDDENLDPKTWCRWPILSGDFASEIQELRDYLQTIPS